MLSLLSVIDMLRLLLWVLLQQRELRCIMQVKQIHLKQRAYLIVVMPFLGTIFSRSSAQQNRTVRLDKA
jgi:hypothetical protein